MSHVYSFRLDENNPREAQAIHVIKAWTSEGYSLRYTLVEALITVSKNSTSSGDLPVTIDQITTLLQKLQGLTPSQNSVNRKEVGLSEAFMSSVILNSRPGLRID